MNANRDFPPGSTGVVRCCEFPPWVRREAWDEDPGPDIELYSDDGLLRLMQETQIDLTSPGVVSHIRVVQRIRARAGAERAAHVAIEFDPSHERVDVHRITVWRAGQPIEHAREGAFQMLRREQGLERLALDGRLTATLLVPDLRVDDTLELAFTRYSAHPVLNGRYGGWIMFNGYTPWVQTRHRIRRPPERRLWVRGFNSPPAATVQVSDGVEESCWISTRPERITFEELQAPWDLRNPFYQVTEFADWNEVARLFEPHYRDIELPAEINVVLSELAARHTDPADLVVEWLRFVQRELRYFALSLGEGGLVPRRLETIWSQRFGDCKDATRLFVAGARHLGLDACAALVSTGLGLVLDTFLPAVHLFDHAIARVRLNGQTYWLDPTRQRQGGSLQHIVQPHGFGLALTPETTDLERLPEAQPLDFINCRDSIDVGPKFDSPATLTRVIEFRQDSADQLRSQIENEGFSKIAAHFLKRVQEDWPDSVESVQPTVHFDQVENVLAVSATYEIRNAWALQAGRPCLRLVDHFLVQELQATRNAQRKTAICLGRPRRLVWQTRVHMPRRWKGEGWSDVADDGIIRFTNELVIGGDRTVLLTKTLSIGKWSLPAAQLAAYSDIATKLSLNATNVFARVRFGRIIPGQSLASVIVQRGLPRWVRWAVSIAVFLALRFGTNWLDWTSPPQYPRSLPPPPSASQFEPPPAPPPEAPLESASELSIQVAKDASAAFEHADSNDPYVERWLEGIQAVAQPSHGKGGDRFRSLIGSGEFLGLTSVQKHAGLLLAGLVALDHDERQAAHRYLVRASEMAGANATDWSARYVAARSISDWDDSVYALTTMLRRWRSSKSAVKDRELRSLLSPERPGQVAQEAVFNLLNVLFDSGWRLEGGAEPGYLWTRLAVALNDRGEPDRAALVVARIHLPREVLALRVDRRYAGLVQRFPDRFDVSAAGRQEVADYRQAARQLPRSLHAVGRLAYAYLDVGRYADALSLTNTAIGLATRPTGSEAAYDDGPESLNWIYDCRARALLGMQKLEEAEADLRRAAQIAQSGRSNVSNEINLAMFYAEGRRAAEAVKILNALSWEAQSPYGRMQGHFAFLTAAVDLNDRARIADELDYLRKHQSDSVATFQFALVRGDRLDEAATVLIRRLRDPALRPEALQDVQTYMERAVPPLVQEFQKRWDEVLDRQDVRAAIEAVGKKEAVPLPPQMW